MNNEYVDTSMQQNEEEAIQEMKEYLLHNDWVEEAKQIPLGAVSSEERTLLIKCIQEETLTDEELQDLEQLLGRYRQALRKYEPEETLEAVDKNIELVQTEKSVLEMMRNARQEQTITMMYPVTNTEIIQLDLLVFTEIDAEAIDNLQQNLELFADLTTEEMQTYSDYTKDKPQTREEQVIAERIEQKILEKGQNNIGGMRKVAIQFLAKQTRLLNDENSTEEGMKDIYSEMKLGYLLALFEKVQGMTGITQIDTDNLFR